VNGSAPVQCHTRRTYCIRSPGGMSRHWWNEQNRFQCHTPDRLLYTGPWQRQQKLVNEAEPDFSTGQGHLVHPGGEQNQNGLISSQNTSPGHRVHPNERGEINYKKRSRLKQKHLNLLCPPLIPVEVS
jgi:hypothetical protein